MDVNLEVPGLTMALMAVLAVIEQDALAEGRQSVLARSVEYLEGKTAANVISLVPHLEQGPPKEWRDQAIVLLGMAQQIADRTSHSQKQ